MSRNGGAGQAIESDKWALQIPGYLPDHGEERITSRSLHRRGGATQAADPSEQCSNLLEICVGVEQRDSLCTTIYV